MKNEQERIERMKLVWAMAFAHAHNWWLQNRSISPQCLTLGDAAYAEEYATRMADRAMEAVS